MVERIIGDILIRAEDIFLRCQNCLGRSQQKVDWSAEESRLGLPPDFLNALYSGFKLNQEEEIILSKLIKSAKENPGVMADWGIRARKTLVLSRLDLAVSLAVKKQIEHRMKTGMHLELAELIQAGCYGLAEAAEKFDTDKKAKFSTHAFYYVRNRIQRERVRISGTIRPPFHPPKDGLNYYHETISLEGNGGNGRDEEVSWEETLAINPSQTFEPASLDRLTIEHLVRISELTPLETYILWSHYFLGETLEEIGKRINISSSLASYREQKALKKLKASASL